MARLAAVACVALAAKIEETRVPVLLDLQLCAAGEAYVFEAKTVRRMELLVLSALGWRMHPVTPFSYLEPLLADAAVRLHYCETVLLAVLIDLRWPRHRPSAWAAAALVATTGSGDDDAELLALINAPEDEVVKCAKIISEATGMSFLAVDAGTGNKRKHAATRMYSPPLSPSGVIGGALSCFSCESSSSATADSRFPAAVTTWPASAPVSVSSSPEPHGRPPKRTAAAALPLPPDEESRDAWPSICAA
uniref:Cyclin N-terminal domain-containing protein n=1 Tax=Arundo donax TaxID=35708 RepID=A0A0A9FB96_ARUDO